MKKPNTIPGQVFLLQAMAQASKTFSARPPSVPLLRRSSRIKWLSEPPTQRKKVLEDTAQWVNNNYEQIWKLTMTLNEISDYGCEV